MKTGICYGAPKTPESQRSIQLPEQLVTAIREHQARQAEERAGMGWGPTAYVFTAISSGGRIYPHSISDSYKQVAKLAGVTGFRAQDLRHSAASFLLAEGVKIKRVQAILGHANVI